MIVQRAAIIGVKKFKGVVDDTPYDNCKVRVLLEADESSSNERGFNVAELAYGTTSDRFVEFKYVKFPFNTELELDVNLKNGRQSMRLVKFTPIVK